MWPTLHIIPSGCVVSWRWWKSLLSTKGIKENIIYSCIYDRVHFCDSDVGRSHVTLYQLWKRRNKIYVNTPQPLQCHRPSLLLLYPKTLRNWCAQFKSSSLLSQFPSIYHRFWHWSNSPWNSYHMVARIVLSSSSPMSLLQYSLVVILYVTTYTICLLSHIHVNTTHLLGIVCTSIAACMILRRLECVLFGKTISCHLKALAIVSPLPQNDFNPF